MRILAVYRAVDAGLIRLWERSWRARGWTPGLLSPKEVESCSARAAAATRRASLVCNARTINFSYRVPRARPVRIKYKKFGTAGWQSADVVQFPAGMTEADILQCGRRI